MWWEDRHFQHTALQGAHAVEIKQNHIGESIVHCEPYAMGQADDEAIRPSPLMPRLHTTKAASPDATRASSEGTVRRVTQCSLLAELGLLRTVDQGQEVAFFGHEEDPG
jgi:hypothetical protein